jgi:hypothetical protein
MDVNGSLVLDLIIVLALLGLLAGVVLLYRKNQAKSARTQAMFGVGGVPAPVKAGVTAQVTHKRTYTWPDRIGYYVTFQADGTRPVELEVSHEWYGYLGLGDRGLLAVEGGQFGGFNKAG